MSIARFTDRGVFVTGAGSGLGRATAKLFAAEGARVFGVDVSALASTLRRPSRFPARLAASS